MVPQFLGQPLFWLEYPDSNLPCSSAFYNIAVSLGEVAVISGVFLARYRSKKTRVNWKITLAETIVIVIIATVVSLLLGSI